MALLSRTLRNVIATYIGRGLVAFSQVLFVPVYIKMLGIESYGVIGFATALNILFSMLDVGMSLTLSRQLADLLSRNQMEKASQLIRSSEIVGGAATLLVAVLSWPLATWIGAHWLKLETLDPILLRDSLVLVLLTCACRFSMTVYTGSFYGMQKHIKGNALQASFAVLRSGGVCLVMLVAGATLPIFFAWQLVMSVLQVVVGCLMVWRMAPRGVQPKWSLIGLEGSWRFATGATVFTALTMLSAQLDKLWASKVLPLDILGQYTLAALVSMSLLTLVSPIFAVLMPRLTELLAKKQDVAIVDLYHTACEFITVIGVTVGMVMVAFPNWILTGWTGDPALAAAAAPILRWTAVGTILQMLVVLPSGLMLSQGKTRLLSLAVLWGQAVSVPVLWWATDRYGAVGAATYWPVQSAIYAAFVLYFIHQDKIVGKFRVWLIRDTLIPSLAAFAIIVAVLLVVPTLENRYLQLGAFALLCLLCVIAALLGTTRLRRQVMQRLPVLSRWSDRADDTHGN